MRSTTLSGSDVDHYLYDRTYFNNGADRGSTKKSIVRFKSVKFIEEPVMRCQEW